LFFYVVFDIFVYGKLAKKSPYAIKILTQMQLSNIILEGKNSLNIKTVYFRGLFFLFFSNFGAEYQFGFQDPATFLMEGIIDLHHDIMFFLL
jgi:hypothetical protein